MFKKKQNKPQPSPAPPEVVPHDKFIVSRDLSARDMAVGRSSYLAAVNGHGDGEYVVYVPSHVVTLRRLVSVTTQD